MEARLFWKKCPQLDTQPGTCKTNSWHGEEQNRWIRTSALWLNDVLLHIKIEENTVLFFTLSSLARPHVPCFLQFAHAGCAYRKKRSLFVLVKNVSLSLSALSSNPWILQTGTKAEMKSLKKKKKKKKNRSRNKELAYPMICSYTVISREGKQKQASGWSWKESERLKTN